MGFRYTGIRVRDMDRSIDFYTRLLGMRVTFRFKIKETGGRIAVLKSPRGSQRLELNWYPPVGLHRRFRHGDELANALGAVRALKAEAYRNVADTEKAYNTNLLHVLELDSLLNAAELVLVGALARQESRGAHTRLDFPKRDDVNWLKHTIAHRTADGPRLSFVPVTITKHQPVERKY